MRRAPVRPDHHAPRPLELPRPLALAAEVLHMPASRVHDDHARPGVGPRGIQNVEVARAVEADVLDRGELLPLGPCRGGPDAVHRFEIHGKRQILSRQIDHLLCLDTGGSDRRQEAHGGPRSVECMQSRLPTHPGTSSIYDDSGAPRTGHAGPGTVLF